jgi:dTDP-4-dehydrorhamnose reductase
MDIQKISPSDPEIWGGIECTINRVGDKFSDQLSFTQCYESDSFIDGITQLGIKAIRFPVLWEKHEPVKNKTIDWTWSANQLNKLRDHGIEPIAGLVHHGSGPAYTNLLDPDFPELLSKYALQVAERFPWINHYTPVNEPLTTARFSGLYGLWYPHKTDDKSFMRMLLNQLKGTVLSMRAIRSVNKDAKLVQTEDLAKIHSTSLLRYQRDFENQRRWLTYDLLCGRINNEHALWKFCLKAGIKKEELLFFVNNPCPPDIMGLNYYVTSERYLDENINRYPACSHGGNGKHKYADVEAVRVIKPAGIKYLLRETWKRYRLPLAITEVHMGCTREEQMRWFHEIWEEGLAARKQGVDLKAVTAWSLFGSYNWNSLLTRSENHYESGLFDTRNNTLRKTGLAKLVAAIANGNSFHHPLLQENGWWKRDERFYQRSDHKIKKYPVHKNNAPPLLITGRTGTLGNAFARICQQRNIPYVLLSREQMNITYAISIEHAIDQYKPWALVNTAGYVNVDGAENDPENCFRVNALAPELLAQSCRQHNIPLVVFSSDLVFDGGKKNPYTETDLAGPLNVYGKSKAYAEQLVEAANPSALIIRTSSFFGPWDQHNFAHHVIDTLKNGHAFAACDMVMSPTYVPDLVNTALDLLVDEEKGIWHLCNDGLVSWVDFAIELAMRAGLSKNKIAKVSAEEMQWKAKRPSYSAMQSNKGIQLPSLERAIENYFRDKIF